MSAVSRVQKVAHLRLQIGVVEALPDIDNLYVVNAVESRRYRTEIALQIHNLPEGASVTFKVVE